MKDTQLTLRLNDRKTSNKRLRRLLEHGRQNRGVFKRDPAFLRDPAFIRTLASGSLRLSMSFDLMFPVCVIFTLRVNFQRLYLLV